MTERIFVTVLAGYLGAGKTTILNSVLSSDHGLRMAVLVNDFGKVNIDAGLMRNASGDTIELTNGCVCCTIGDDLGEVLTRLRNQDLPPDWVIIEASGVTDPNRLAMQSGHWPGFSLSSIVVAVDSETIRERAQNKFISHLIQTQIRSADTIAVTKEDLISQDKAAATRKWLHHQNTRAKLFSAPLDQLQDAALFGTDTRDLGSVMTTRDQVSHGFHTRVWRPDAPIELSVLRRTLGEFPETIQRIKGSVIDGDSGESVLIQMVGSRLEIRPGGSKSDPCLVLIAIDDAQTVIDACDCLSSLFNNTLPATKPKQESRVLL